MGKPRLSSFGFMPIGCVAIAAFAALGGGASATDNPNQTGVESPLAVVGPQKPHVAPGRLPQLPPMPVQAPRAPARAEALTAKPGSLPKSANAAAIVSATCPDDALSYGYPVVCGYVPVPLELRSSGDG